MFPVLRACDSRETGRDVITGHTALFCILADPVDHVRTPTMFNAYLQKIGVDAVLVPVHVVRQDLAEVVRSLRAFRNLRGLLVTLPHKIDILGLCDELDASAQHVGAANVVRREPDGRMVGANFDGRGFVGALEAAVGKIAGRSIFIAGAGGVARAIAFEGAHAGVARLSIYNRASDKADALLAAIARAYPGVMVDRGTARPDDCDIAINATSLGLHAGDVLPFTVDALPARAIVAEVVMQPLITPLLHAARARGIRIVTGDGMLDFQFPFWIDFFNATTIRGTPPAPPVIAGSSHVDK
jgi:shikimate dehydrogenase